MLDKKKFYINGEWVSPKKPNDFKVTDPSTEEECAVISLGGVEDVNDAVSAATKAFETWAFSTKEERLKYLEALYVVYKKRWADMAKAITLEMGAPIDFSTQLQAGTGASHIKSYIKVLKEYTFEAKLGEHALNNNILHEPKGVCALITPWNWPMNQTCLKVIPAIAAGCTMVLKPSEIAPLSSMILPLGWIGVMYAAAVWVKKHNPVGFFFSDLWYEFFMGLVPPSALVAFALGSILFGWATPTEGAACGAFGALILAAAYRKLNSQKLFDALLKTLEISVLILFLVAASNFFGAVFSRLGTPTMITDFLLAWDLSPMMILLIIMAFIFLLGWPLEWVPIVLIIVPILIPVLIKLDINLTWFGILVAVNLQTAWLSPPVALSAYFLKGVVPEWDLKDIYLGMMQFMVIQLIGLTLIFLFPQIALWLPNYIYGQ